MQHDDFGDLFGVSSVLYLRRLLVYIPVLFVEILPPALLDAIRLVLCALADRWSARISAQSLSARKLLCRSFESAGTELDRLLLTLFMVISF